MPTAKTDQTVRMDRLILLRWEPMSESTFSHIVAQYGYHVHDYTLADMLVPMRSKIILLIEAPRAIKHFKANWYTFRGDIFKLFYLHSENKGLH